MKPDDIGTRHEAGHWEGELIVGRRGRSHLITLVERHSRYLIALPIPDATSRVVVAALARTFTALAPTIRQSLT
ncbi:hypothetical protein V2J56_14825 [Georgenia sp. MJ206]|uniref:hypothetical protein n=1 Tax=Georgenia wangjunii TaxID=3117730 RepID=UPI002F26254F